jgi:hypothetical protein
VDLPDGLTRTLGDEAHARNDELATRTLAARVRVVVDANGLECEQIVSPRAELTRSRRG